MRFIFVLTMALICFESVAGDQMSYYDDRAFGGNSGQLKTTPETIEKTDSSGKVVKEVLVDRVRSRSMPESENPFEGDEGSLAKEQLNRSKDFASRGKSSVQLPPAMENGIKEIESGIIAAGSYSKEVANNIKTEGLRGFMAVSPEMKAEGRVIGEKIGTGVRGVMGEVGKEMEIDSRGLR